LTDHAPPGGGEEDRMLSDEVYEQLLGLLASGAWPKESRLPSEHELARRFAVSRPILRQALARLRAEGRVQSRKGAGTYVREAPRPTGFAFGPLGSIPEVRRFLEFRCSLEAEMAALATRAADAAAVSVIRQAQQRLDQALAAGAPGIEEDIGFHMAIAQATGNRFFVETLAALAEQMAFGIRLTRDLSTRPLQDRSGALAEEHARIAAAIEAGDSEAAKAAMQDHLTNGIRRLFGS